MKKNDVPRDDEKLFEGKFEEIQYATDENGNYVQAGSPGWAPKNIILKEEWQAIDQEAEAARQEVLAGHKSPLYFHMKINQMDVKLLAGYAEMPRFRIRRLLKPKHFEKISAKDTDKLTFALRISEEELKRIPEQPVNSLKNTTHREDK